MAYEPSIRDILINVLEDCEQALDPTRSNGYINRFIPANPESHMEWAAYLQLNLSAKWALDRIFILPRIVKCLTEVFIFILPTYLFFIFSLLSLGTLTVVISL